MKILRAYLYTILGWGLAGLAMSSIVACDPMGEPVASPEATAAGKAFEAPPPNMAALYIYRERAGNVAQVSAGQRTLGQLYGRDWLRVELRPGTYDLRCSLPAWPAFGSGEVSLTGGETKVLAFREVLTSVWSATCNFTIVPIEAARSSIQAGVRRREVAD